MTSSESFSSLKWMTNEDYLIDSGSVNEYENVSSVFLSKECDGINTAEDGKEATENCENSVEEPKVGMTFDTSDEAYQYYSCYAKEKGFAVAKRTSRKGRDENLKDLILTCNRAGKARVTTINPVKPRPQSRIGCEACVVVVLCKNGKKMFTLVALEHNHEPSPGKTRFYKSYRVLEEQVNRKLVLNDTAEIRTHKTFDSLQIQAGEPDKLPFIKKDCRNYLDKIRLLRLVEGDDEAMHNYFMRMKADNSDFFFAMEI